MNWDPTITDIYVKIGFEMVKIGIDEVWRYHDAQKVEEDIEYNKKKLI
jgi:hypothetical protein